MKKKNQKIVDEFLLNADAISDDVLDDTEKMLGVLPFIFPVMRERAGTFALSALADYRICRPEHLSPKTAELVAIAAAAGAGADNCMRVHMKAAVKEGATRDEIFDTVMIAGTIGKTKVLASALRQLCDAFPEEKKEEATKRPGVSGNTRKPGRKSR
ncbi:MAG TPA: carboxymuconolactone decarboxylase family protein [Methanoregula sp.]|nr:carboxymuconolactone decarboxylase family protein [Methanoregula sp.]